MKPQPFALERYFAAHEFTTPHVLCASDCESLTVGELLAMEPGAAEGLQKLWLGYTEAPGGVELRREIAGMYDSVTEDQVLVHTGAEEAIFTFASAALRQGDHVIVHYPCYQSLREIPRAMGCDVSLWHAREEEGWALCIEELKRLLRRDTRAVIFNVPHNPTGYLLPREDFDELVALSQDRGFLLFSDEVYRLLEYEGTARLPALSDVDERGVSLGVMSKSFGLAGLRVGWAVTRNRSLYEGMARVKDYTTICNSGPSEFLASVALRNRERIVARNRAIIDTNLALLDDCFARHSQYLQWHRPLAGPVAFPSVSFDGGPRVFCDELVARTGVLLAPGNLFGEGFDNVRLGFGRADLPRCLEKLEAYLHELR